MEQRKNISRKTMNQDLFDQVVTELKTIVDKTGNRLNMDSIMISQGDKVFSHFFTAEGNRNDLRSISKPILCLAIGIALAEGLVLRGERITLDTLIWPYFKDKINLRNERNKGMLQKVKLRHLLNHTMGYDVGLMFSKDIEDRDPSDLLNYIFNTDVIHEPGTKFVYSNVGPYIFSALIGEECGVNLSEWVDKHLFSRIGIADYEWKDYGNYCAACTGLKLKISDLHKIGKLFINNGHYQGTQVIPESWIDSMRKVQISTPTMYDETRVFPKFGYGYYLYICKNGTYYCDGTNGQYLIVLPESEILITTFGHQSDMKPITRCFGPLL